MTTTTLRHLVDSYIAEDHPAENYAEQVKLKLSNASGAQRVSFLFFGGGPRPGVFVVEATLRVFTRQAWTGTPVLTVQRITEAWKERTLKWRNRPAATSTGAATKAIGGALGNGEMIEIDVTDIVRTAFLGSGAAFYGFEISTSGSAERLLHSSEAEDPDVRPRLAITYSSAPTQAVDLVPGDESVISTDLPVLAWTHYDVDGDEQAAARVQIDGGDNFVDPEFDSGWIATTESQIALADTAYAGLVSGGSFYWRVQTEDTTGQQSAWSESVRVTRIDKGVLTIESPTSLVEEATPEIVTTLTGQTQAQIAYLIEELDVDGVTWHERWSRRRFAAPAASGAQFEFEVPTPEPITVNNRRIAPPPIRLKDHPYRLTVRAWDDIAGRAWTPGDPPYAEASVEFQWVDAVTDPTAPSSLEASQESAHGPGVVLAWTRAAVPDYWSLMVDGVLVIDKVPALDWQVSGENYSMTYYGAEPLVEHTYEILALEVA